MWSRQSDEADLPDTLMKSFVSEDPDLFLNIIILVILGCTLLATYAEAGRSFSVLRLMKSHLRNLMADTRFSALILMKIHNSKYIDSKQIADRFVNEHATRLLKANLLDELM